MKLHELISEPAGSHQVECDPCRLLAGGIGPHREIAGETIRYPGGTMKLSLVEDELSGEVSRQWHRVDDHLGGVED